MKLEQQVVSLKLSKQLKEAEYKQEGIWWWAIFGIPRPSLKQMNKPLVYANRYCVAPTVAELGERLREISGQECSTEKMLGWKGYKFDIELQITQGIITEANARAKMWLYLKNAS